MQPDVATYEFTLTNSAVSRPNDWEPQISYKFGLKAKTNGQAN